MSKEGNFFKVKGNRFWILEQRVDEEHMEKRRKGKEEEYRVNAWVFDNEMDAILKLKELITKEEIDFSSLDEVIKRISEKYNLQEVVIAKDKYNMRAVSWLKVALLGFAQK